MVYGAALFLLLVLWHRIVLHAATLRAVATFALLVTLSFAYGRYALRATALARAGRSSFALEFVFGFLLLDMALFVLLLVSPLGITADIAILAIAALAAWTGIWRRHAPSPATPDALPGVLALVLCGIATTIWCTDALTPIVRNGSTTIVRLWGDSYVHARHISAFANAHGLRSMSDIRMAGMPLYLYHYASYALSAAVSAMTRTPAYETFANFLLPVGVLLTGLAAFAFAAALWGRGPAAATAFALLLLPDAWQQGFGNKYLSYDFMQQVNVGGLYGVACMAVAWTFVIHGCRSRSVASIIVGWAVALMTLPFKAHVFVANAFLIMMYPPAFLADVRWRRRLAVAAGLIACFLLAVNVSQMVDRVPTLRLDGSSARAYVAYLLANQDAGWMKSLVVHGLGGPPWPVPRLAFYGSILVVFGTFGYWTIAAIVAALLERTRSHAAIWSFPLLVMTNYVAMALGLAMDTKGIGSPDELLNRPLVWAYFAVVAWTAGAVYHRLFGAGLPASARTRVALASVALLALAVPLNFARDLQTFPHWGILTLDVAGGVPTCLVDAARFIRGHSAVTDVVQDSENDPRLLVSALSERADYAMYATSRPPAGLDRRLADLARFERLSDADEINAFAARTGIAWYLLHPGSEVRWPASVRDHAVFECGGYRVFHFARRPAGSTRPLEQEAQMLLHRQPLAVDDAEDDGVAAAAIGK